MNGIIITSIVCVTLIVLRCISLYDIRKTYDANVQGFLLTKSDRINSRMEKYSQTIKKQNSMVAESDVRKFVKDMQIMIAQELNEKGIPRKWRK